MADVRDVSQTKSKWIEFLKSDLLFILDFLKNPIQRISQLPDWSWKKIIILNAGLSVTAGVLNGLIGTNHYQIAFGILFLPIITFMMTHVLAGFFYYYFQVFEKRTVDFLSLLRMIFLSNVPFLIVHTLTAILPPLTFLGLAFAGMILVVGLTDHFKLEKKRAIKLVVLLYAMVFLVWIWDRLDTRRLGRSVSAPLESTF
jgi:hypothetical protein